MDASEMHELLYGYLGELTWGGGVTKDDMVAHLAGRDEALRTMINEYVPEGNYSDLQAVVSLIPSQAWQDVQGDAWRGPEDLLPEDVPTNFGQGQVVGDATGVYREGGPPPSTPGFGSTSESQDAGHQ